MEPQAFQIQLTRRDYLRYFVRHYFFDLWTPWIVATGVAIAVTLLYISVYTAWWQGAVTFVGVLASTLLAMFLLSTLIFALKLRNMKEGGIVLERKAVTVDDGGVAVQGSGSSAQYDWSQIEWVRERGRFVFVKLGGGEILLLWPRRDVPQGVVSSMRHHLTAGAAA